MRRAVFLDRDGVLIEDVHLLTHAADIRVTHGVPKALCQLKETGFALIVVSNQTVVSRGLITESEMRALQATVEQTLIQLGAPPLDGFYYCPHHPNATLAAYRVDCQCRKPRPGLLLRAAEDHDIIDLSKSFMVGDRLTDVLAGAKAGCRTVLVQTGAHLHPRIETPDVIDGSYAPDHICSDLFEAAEWILRVN